MHEQKVSVACHHTVVLARRSLPKDSQLDIKWQQEDCFMPQAITQ